MKNLPKPKKKDGLKIAGSLSSDDKQLLRDYAKTLKKSGTPAAAKELERLNKMYRNYGMSFGSIKGA